MKRFLKSSGIALATTLLMASVLLIMMISLIMRLRGQSFFSVESSSGVAALYAAEAGLSDVLSHLAQDPTYGANLNGNLNASDASYSLQFSSTGCVNNLAGPGILPGPRGPVAPGTAYIVSVGQAGGTQRTVEAVVAPAPPVAAMGAIASSGQVHMLGNAMINGYKGNTDQTSVPGDIISTLATNADNLITWGTLFSGDAANVTGQIKITSPDTSSINVAGATVAGGTHVNQSALPLPPVDIVGRISAKSSAPAPTLTLGATSLASGDFYQSGDLNYAGDLQLNGSNLYVNGSVNITGTIRGTGSLFVASNTTFYGDSQIQAGNNSQQVALYSQGNVSLHGFDGANYLSTAASLSGNDSKGVPYSTDLVNAQNLLAVQKQDLDNFAINPIESSTLFGSQHSAFDKTGDCLAHEGVATDWAGPGTGGIYSAPLRRLEEMVEAQPPGPTRTFMMNKFDSLLPPVGSDYGGGVFGWATPVLAQNIAAGLLTGATNMTMDGVNDSYSNNAYWSAYPGGDPRSSIFSALRALHGQLDFNRLGTAYFNGLVYSNGGFTADNDLSITGALIVNGNIYLNNNCSITYVQDAVSQAGLTVGAMGVKLWIVR